MKRSAPLWSVLLLGAAGVACHEDGAWQGHVDLWPIPREGNDRVDLGGGDAGMDATVPDDDPRSYFDARQVYLVGSLTPGACFRRAIAPVLQPDDAVVGFNCLANLSTAQIRPTDGRLFYVERGDLYMFSADLGGAAVSNLSYPERPLDNDVVVSLPACPGQTGTRAFKLSASGVLFYRCGENWYDGDNTFVAMLSDTVLQVGLDGSALTENGIHSFASSADAMDAAVPDAAVPDAAVNDVGDDAAVNDAGDDAAANDAGADAAANDAGDDAAVHDAGDAGQLTADAGMSQSAPSLTPFVGLPAGARILASRTVLDGYWIVLSVPTDASAAELWHVDVRGHASLVGSYPALPANQYLFSSIEFGSQLDGDGALYQLAAYTTEGSRETIVRRTLQGESSVVYDEGDDPLVEIYSSSLITGP